MNSAAGFLLFYFYFSSLVIYVGYLIIIIILFFLVCGLLDCKHKILKAVRYHYGQQNQTVFLYFSPWCLSKVKLLSYLVIEIFR